MTQDSETDHTIVDRRASSNMDATSESAGVNSEDVSPEEDPVENSTSELLDDLREKSEKFENNWKRAVADLQNYKKRVESERSLQAQAAQIALVINLLPICDDFDRAMEAVKNEGADQSWFEGFEAIQRKLNGLLEAMGIMEISALGEPFDPEFHEALARQDGPENICIEVIQQGFKLGDRVIRPVQVIVGEGISTPSAEHEKNTKIEEN